MVARNASAGAAQVNAEVIDRYLTSVETELTGKVDSKSAVAGQQVSAKIRASVSLADGTSLPKGTRLVGHLTQVQAYSKDQPYATLAMSFDHAELKGGQSVALRVVIRAVAPPERPSAAQISGLATDKAVAPTQVGSLGGPASASSRSGLGSGGAVGLGGAPVRSVEQAGSPAIADRVPGGPVNSAGETVSSAPRATALPGVVLSNSAPTSKSESGAGAANVSGTLRAAGRNISLDSGTEITMGVIAR